MIGKVIVRMAVLCNNPGCAEPRPSYADAKHMRSELEENYVPRYHAEEGADDGVSRMPDCQKW